MKNMVILCCLLLLSAALHAQNNDWLQKGMEEKDPHKKIGFFTKSLAAGEDSAAALFCRASVFHELGDSRSAIADYSLCIGIDPEDAAAYYNRGCEKKKLGDFEGALEDLVMANELDPANGNNVCTTCVLYSIMDDNKNALLCYQTCLDLTMDKAGAYNNIGYCYLSLEMFTEALAHFGKALELKPGYANAVLGKALAFHFLHDKVNEKAALGEFLELKPILKLGPEGFEVFKKEGGFLSVKNEAALREMLTR